MTQPARHRTEGFEAQHDMYLESLREADETDRINDFTDHEDIGYALELSGFVPDSLATMTDSQVKAIYKLQRAHNRRVREHNSPGHRCSPQWCRLHPKYEQYQKMAAKRAEQDAVNKRVKRNRDDYAPGNTWPPRRTT